MESPHEKREPGLPVPVALARASAAMKRRDYEEASALLAELLSREPRNGDALALRDRLNDDRLLYDDASSYRQPWLADFPTAIIVGVLVLGALTFLICGGVSLHYILTEPRIGTDGEPDYMVRFGRTGGHVAGVLFRCAALAGFGALAVYEAIKALRYGH